MDYPQIITCHHSDKIPLTNHFREKCPQFIDEMCEYIAMCLSTKMIDGAKVALNSILWHSPTYYYDLKTSIISFTEFDNAYRSSVISFYVKE